MGSSKTLLSRLFRLVVQTCNGHSKFFVFLAPRPCFPAPVHGFFIVRVSRLSSRQQYHSKSGRFLYEVLDACNKLAERMIDQKVCKKI